MFKSIEHIKRVGEHFKAGSIVPKRVIGGLDARSRKQSHRITFLCDVWRVSRMDGSQLYLCDIRSANGVIRVRGDGTAMCANLHFDCNPYSDKANNFIGNFNMSDDKWLDIFNGFYCRRQQHMEIDH